MPDLSLKPVELSDREIIEKCFSVCQPGISEYTFTNLFIWAGPKRILFSTFEEGIIFVADYNGQRYFFPPIGFMDCEKTFEILIDYGIKHDIKFIKLIPEYQKKYLKNKSVKIIPDRNNYDYIYKTESMASLKGWRLDGKRGFIKKFTENYNFQYLYYDNQYKRECLNLAEEWAAGKRINDPTVDDELSALKTFLDNFDKLNSKGGIILIDDKVAAFTFGEKLNDTTFVIHFEKADYKYTGCYQVINQLFAKNEIFGNYIFINREQDMGIEGIRKAKMSYVPLRLLKKYTAVF